MHLRRRKGLVIGYVLLSVILLAAVAGVVSLTQNDQAGYATITRISKEVVGQANLIRQQISNCVTNYPTPAVAVGRPWPEETTTGLTVIGATRDVRLLECPNAPVGREALFGGFDGSFLPPPPNGLGEWTYTAAASPSVETYISISLVSAKQNSASYQEGLRLALASFASNEASGYAGGSVNNSNPTSIRVWLRR